MRGAAVLQAKLVSRSWLQVRDGNSWAVSPGGAGASTAKATAVTVLVARLGLSGV